MAILHLQLLIRRGRATVAFDGREVTTLRRADELVLAYATIDKSQGSEYPAVVIPW